MRGVVGALCAGLLILNMPSPVVAQPALAVATPWTVPSDAEIKAILVQRIDAERQGVGIVVGIIDPKGSRIVSYGVGDKTDPRPIDGRSVFEIGSITKVFTSLLLSKMVQDGQVKLDDPVGKYLPQGTKVPERGGRQITLIDLATHSSGLPRMPTNFRPKDAANPYADYTPADAYAFLGSYSLPRDIGAQYEYSNFGAGLLGLALARRAGLDYPTLVERRILKPLGMASTSVALSADQKARLAKGHDIALAPTANWDLDALVGAGGLRSDTEDMLTFLAAELGLKSTPLKFAMQAQLAPRRPTAIPDTEIALAWHIKKSGESEVIWHNGGTGGYRSFMGFDPKAKVGVVVLTNASTSRGGDDIGLHILAGSPLQPPPRDPAAGHPAIALDAKTLDLFVGRYQFAPNVFLTVNRNGDRLFTQLTGQQAIEVFAESRTGFFLRVVDAQLSFDLPPTGPATAVTLHQNGREVIGRRVAEP